MTEAEQKIQLYLDKLDAGRLEEELVYQHEAYVDSPVRTFSAHYDEDNGFQGNTSSYSPIEPELYQPGSAYKYDMPKGWPTIINSSIDWYADAAQIESEEEETARIIAEIKDVAKARYGHRTEAELIAQVCHS